MLLPGEPSGTDPPLIPPSPQRWLHPAAPHVRVMLQVPPPAADVKLCSQNHRAPSPCGSYRHHLHILWGPGNELQQDSRAAHGHTAFPLRQVSQSCLIPTRTLQQMKPLCLPWGGKGRIFLQFLSVVQLNLLFFLEQTAERAGE